MIELLSNAEMAEADRRTIAAGVAGIDLMERAGLGVAERAAARFSPGARIAVLAGPGNNGGDGFIAASVLAERGDDVRVLLLGDVSRLSGDAAEAAGRWTGPTISATPQALDPADLIIDALFGAGLDRPVQGLAHDLIEAANASGIPIIAVDLPSGINGTTGAVMGIAINASETVTFFRRKPAHLLLPGRLHCGLVKIVDIGIPASVLDGIGSQAFANGPDLWAEHFPVPRVEGHKYSRGHAVIASGGFSFTGAARLSARGALRAGAGLVTIASPRDALIVNAVSNLAIMVRPVDGADELFEFMADPRHNALALGPGGGVGPSMRYRVRAALDGDQAVVLDADALTSFADEPRALIDLLAARTDRTTVLTPHEGEFSRVFSGFEEVREAKSKLERTRLAASLTKAVVLLKGADTIVAAPDGRASISDNGPPWLATAGSGDVLTGMITGLIAQGMPGFEAASAAAWLHGEAGIEAGPGLIAEDLPEQLPKLFRRLFVDLAARL